MNRIRQNKFRHAAIVVLLLWLLMPAGCRRFSKEPSMFINPRCAKNVSGQLKVVIILPNGSAGGEKTFDLASICQELRVELDDYRMDSNLQFTLERKDGKKYELFSRYGEDIQHEPDGTFNIILSLTDALPFIANDLL